MSPARIVRAAIAVAVVVVVAWAALVQPPLGGAEFFTDHFFYISRLIGALLAATLVPLLIDRHFRR